MELYEDLLRDLNNKVAALKADIRNNWQQYLSHYLNIMEDIDTWLRYLDKSWLAITRSAVAQDRLTESSLMKKKGREYAANWLPWLRNEAPLSTDDTREVAVNKSAALIIEHATRRVDFYFMTALFFYNKPATITLIDPDRYAQHVHGVQKYNTEASHSAIISNFDAQKKTGEVLSTGPHLLKTLNTTVELPTVVNDFDGALEGKIQEHLQSRWRKISIQILHNVSGNADEPRKAIVKFLINMLDFFTDEKIKTRYWSISSSVEDKLTYVFQCIGTFYFLWSKTCTLDHYIHLFMRVGNDEIQKFQERKYVRVNKYKMLSDEIAGIPIANHWINQFFASDLSDDSKKSTLRKDDFTIDILDNLLCYQETFDAAMTLLLDLIDEDSAVDIDFNNPHYNCFIIYRISRVFSPLMGGISYEQRLKYLEHHLFAAEDSQKIFRSLVLIRALYRCIKIVSLQEIPEDFGSLIYPEDTKIKWGIPQTDNNNDDPIIEKYYLAIAKFIIRAAMHPDNSDLRSCAMNFIHLYLESNIDNLLAENTTRQIINLFLIGLPIKDRNDSDSEGIAIYEILNISSKIEKNDISMLRNDLAVTDIEFFKRRINEFHICIAINLHREFLNEYSMTDNEDEKVFSWYQHFLADENVEQISYLYDYFNGDSSWKNDIKVLDNLAIFSSTQVQQLTAKIKNVKDSVNRFYSEINILGTIPTIDVTKKSTAPVLGVAQNEEAISEKSSNTNSEEPEKNSNSAVLSPTAHLKEETEESKQRQELRSYRDKISIDALIKQKAQQSKEIDVSNWEDELIYNPESDEEKDSDSSSSFEP